MSEPQITLADRVIVAAAQAWRSDGEIMGTGIGPLPRLAVSLCKRLYNPALATTDGECWYTTEPLPPGGDVATAEIEGWSPYDRVFSGLWGGRRHAMVAPVQLDRFGQSNISVIGDHARPKAAMLGARGFPGNSVHHPNSFFLASHNRRALVSGEVDYVCSAGYNPARFGAGGVPKGIDLRLIVTNLAVMDFGGPDHAVRVVSLHPGVTFEEVQDNTGFDLERIEALGETPDPTEQELGAIRALDPHGTRNRILPTPDRG